MQTVQQYPECGERRYRDERFPDGTARADRSVAHPRRKAAYGSIGKLAENVLACGEPCLSLLAKVEPVQWMPRVMNLNNFRTMGTMFLARAESERVTSFRPWGRRSASRATTFCIALPLSYSPI